MEEKVNILYIHITVVKLISQTNFFNHCHKSKYFRQKVGASGKLKSELRTIKTILS